MKTYKIDNSKISEFTKRSNNRVFKILAITTVTISILMFPMTRQKDAPAELIYIMLFSLLFTTIIVGFIYLNNKKLTRLTAENLKIIIDENSITKVVDVENDPRLNFLHRFAINKAKNITSDIYYSKIDFDNIKPIKKKNGDLWVKAINSNAFNGEHIIVVPKELTNFDELEKEVNNRLK
ncbi:hypothetical protein [Arcicella lustrica]|uniref:Uncharacterized protein n=1 Tax=Arcicella lustrica TaxID=2984196 RepID=A0ABU5SQM2_9BACT|nr:hypothetical protein [Arcicella sp. DC25W]MEA5429619.1 hypothetical protein [Arcicella sp. DC25W]